VIETRRPEGAIEGVDGAVVVEQLMAQFTKDLPLLGLLRCPEKRRKTTGRH
jgi:hypothetical protein